MENKSIEYCATLVDVQRRLEVLDSFRVSACSPGEAIELAYQRLKRRRIYRQDPDVRDFVLFHELGVDSQEVHGLDVPPASMSRLLLRVSIPEKSQ